jgi:AcrR family transcriptional regulator
MFEKILQKKQAFTEQLVRDAVYAAVLQVLTEYGLEKLTVQRVAAAANIGTGTVYNYFKDKDALLVYAAIRLFEQVRILQSEAINSVLSPLGKLQAFLKTTFTFFEKNVAYFRFLEQAQIFQKMGRADIQSHIERITRMLAEIITEGMNRGDFKTVDAYKTASFFHRAMVGTLRVNPELELFDPNKEAESLGKMFEIFLSRASG